jgi:hypothetical protein
MYRQQVSKKTSPSIRSVPISKEIAPSPSYGSLSSVVQRAQQEPNSVSEDERQQLESAIGTRSAKEILAGNQGSWIPEFQGISAQMWGNAGQVGVPIQAKLTIGEVGDKYEQEADRVARDVVQRINQPQTVPPKQEEKVQRQEVPEEEIQMKSLRVPQEAIAGREASTDLDTAINSARGGGQALDEGLQRSIGQAMGADFSGVKVHTDSQADQLNKSIQAKAFTTGQDVFFRQGAYEPGSRGGQELIAHELTHVVQQSGSAVQRKLSQIDYGASVVQRAWEKGKYGVYIWDKELDGLTWYTQGSDLWFDITDESSIKFDIPKDYELYLQLDSNKSQKKSLEEWQSLGLVVPPDILAQAPPDILAQVPHILKFNFAGSGQVAWKTHYGKYPDSEKKQMESANHQTNLGFEQKSV